jgi:hypothetical protein
MLNARASHHSCTLPKLRRFLRPLSMGCNEIEYQILRQLHTGRRAGRARGKSQGKALFGLEATKN